MAELLVKLTWTEEKHLKDDREERYIKVRIAKSVLESFEKYDFWLMRYRDIIQDGYEKVKYEVDSDDEGDAGGRRGRF